jgi:hypothetical protein
MTVTRKNHKSGESLSELLIASLIISFAMIILFSGVKVGSDIMHGSREKFEQYNDKVNEYEEIQAEYLKSLPDPEETIPLTPAPEPTTYTFQISDMNPHK